MMSDGRGCSGERTAKACLFARVGWAQGWREMLPVGDGQLSRTSEENLTGGIKKRECALLLRPPPSSSSSKTSRGMCIGNDGPTRRGEGRILGANVGGWLARGKYVAPLLEGLLPAYLSGPSPFGHLGARDGRCDTSPAPPFTAASVQATAIEEAASRVLLHAVSHVLLIQLSSSCHPAVIPEQPRL
ncbi:hypothetical protein K474DRAFT_1129405 [Panus rudis PR-1116 ss-1]|nr:hypothetical protein K474DRAFT_1129405 [Panus rudis PR-1116 ss-1]